MQPEGVNIARGKYLDTMSDDSTKRFSNRVEDYAKYRPGYPQELVTYLQSQYWLTPDKLIADIGAGTGISSALFLDAGYRVIAVEPNKEMREKAIALLGHYSGFSAIEGTAEYTGLEPGSMDALIAGQAFHWFDAKQARQEFKRVLKGKGLVVLIWNERQTGSAFEKEYDELIRKHGRNYVELNHRNIDIGHIRAFFDPEPVALESFDHKQVFDFEGLQGRLLSSSYMPAKGDKGYDAMNSDLEQLFHRHQAKEQITIHYVTKVYTGVL